MTEYGSKCALLQNFRLVTCSDAFVKGSSIELKSILSNLINNSVESYSHGGVVRVRLQCDTQKCTIFVADNGAGIPAEYLPSIGSKPISFKGSKCRGLGLTHAYKTIQSWCGEISIDSEVGMGTTVKIELSKMNKKNLSSDQNSTWLEGVL